MSGETLPLRWPDGWKRTPKHRQKKSRWSKSFADVRDDLIQELKRFGAIYPVLSTNLSVRRDGLPYANQAEPSDSGAAIYFSRNGKSYVFACDEWVTVRENVAALCAAVKSLRAFEKSGVSHMMERALNAFEALPPPDKPKPQPQWSWRAEMMFPSGSSPSADEIEERFRTLAKKYHPDLGGDREKFEAINRARDLARKELAA
jgi:hypothetical protein